MAKVSIIIVTYNSEKHIYDCLDSIYKYNDIGEELEVIIVDNCSTYFEEMEYKIRSNYDANIKIIQNSTNGGYGQGNNVGIRQADAPIVVIMNPDVRLKTPICSGIYEQFQRNPKLVQLGLKQSLPGIKYGYSFSWNSTICPYISLPLISLTKRVDYYWSRYMYFAGSCFCLRKSSFEQIGLFDEKIFMYHEEEDIHKRLLSLPDAIIKYWREGIYEHLHLPDTINLDFEYTANIRSFQSLKYLYKKYGFDDNKAYRIELQKANFFIVRERIKGLFGKSSKTYMDYLNSWKKLLKQRSI